MKCASKQGFSRGERREGNQNRGVNKSLRPMPVPAIAELIWASPLAGICWRCMMLPGEGLCGCACLAHWGDFTHTSHVQSGQKNYA